MATCAVDSRQRVRKLSLCDLHIRTRHDDSASACREIRAILREIRDSLQPDVVIPAVDSGNHVIGNDEGAGQPEPRSRQQRNPAEWRHFRLSLPARLMPGHFDGLVAESRNGVGATRVGRRRVPANVRFADEVGMNLNTFAMIPSRQGRDDSPLTLVGGGGASPWTRRRVRSPPPPPRFDDDGDPLPLAAHHPNGVDSVDDCARPETEQFRLCFRQPFADLEQFRGRVDRQRVCLENVRVDDWTATSNPLSESSGVVRPSPMAANSVILCCIQTKTAALGHSDERVFARCTSDNWRTFADLPAQRVTGLDSLGLGYERYCFAVRRPASASPVPTVDAPSAAVEFAVCYEGVDATFWDNNDEANYRIEWFYDAGDI